MQRAKENSHDFHNQELDSPFFPLNARPTYPSTCRGSRDRGLRVEVTSSNLNPPPPR